jgi:asparagine synthase (glutamine-hydrolysing)
MCGICGVIGIQSSEESEAVVRRMMAAMLHRGPDEDGVLLSPPVAAGMRRLSIIDLPGGSQPVWNETGTFAVVYNGEIYNFRELRDELETAGHRFRTRSDTEVIVHAYEEWGEYCVRRLHGMFAFAIIEMPQGRAGRATRVFIARDPLGIKPLYYSQAGSTFLFASEVRALLASGCIPARLSAEAVPSYLLFGSISEPMSLVEDVYSLLPGHCMTVSADDPLRTPEPKLYWDAPQAIEKAAEKTRAPKASRSSAVSPAATVRSLLETAVRSHLVADVPVGVFLSSGLDSTAIAALASRVRSGIHTFTVAFPDTEFSEADIARRTAERIGSEHSELKISGDDMVARLDEAISSFDQPSMDGINTYFVSWAARQAGLKVALSGLGSDELFGGYSTFRATANVARIAATSALVPRPVRAFATSRLKNSRSFRASPDALGKAFAAWLDPNLLPHPYFFTRTLFTPQTVVSRMREDAGSWNSMPWMKWLSGVARQSHAMDRFTGVSWLELRAYLANTLLRDTDAMSMRHSLEVRVPFLDTSLVEHLLALPESAKRGSGRPKALLVEALADLLPEEIVNQPKRTFTFPWEFWMRGKLGDRVAVALGNWAPALESCLGGSFAQAVWRNFLRGHTTWSRPWSLYVLNEWVKRNLVVQSAGNVERQKAVAVHVP